VEQYHTNFVYLNYLVTTPLSTINVWL